MDNEPHPHRASKDFSVAAAIIVGCALIAASIFYNGKLMLAKLDNLALGPSQNQAGGVANNQQQQPQQPAPPLQPSGPVSVTARRDAPVLGRDDAKVTLVEFSDFQCPFCQRFYNDTFSALKSKYIDTGKVKLIYRHFPLPFHVNAEKAAEAAECANRQGKFWQYHDVLFKNAQADDANLDAVSLKKYADQLGLNKGKLGFGNNNFNQCLDNGETADVVKQDTAAGSAAGTSGTPTVYVNGKIIVGAQPLASFEQAIDAALK